MGRAKRNLLGNWYGGEAQPFVREEFSLQTDSAQSRS
jgi:hypothetical protein